MPIHFHILDVSARDETVESANEEEQIVHYSSGSGSEDDEFERNNKRYDKRTIAIQNLAKKSIIIHLFGKTADGHSVRVDVRGFKPFFYLRCPDGPPSVHTRAANSVKQYINRHLKDPTVCNLIHIERCKRKELFGFTQDKEAPMLKLTMPSRGLFMEVKNLFCNSNWEPELKKYYGRPDVLGDPFGGTVPVIYEANLDPMLRFLHLRNLKPCNWASLEDFDDDSLNDDELTIIECDWEAVSPCTSPPAATAPFKCASWDIECMSNTGAFPVATKGDPIIQIGIITSILGSKEPSVKHIFTLGTCDEIPDAVVHAYKTEKGLLSGFFKWVQEQDIDIFMGYNIFGFDEKYVMERCEQLGLAMKNERGVISAMADELSSLNRLCEEGSEMKLEEKRLSSSAMGDNFLYLWTTIGRLRIDLYHYIKRGYPLPSYKLDDTSRNFLGESVKAVSEKVDAWELTIGTTVKQDVAKGRSVVLLNAGGDSLCDKLDVLDYEPGSGRLIVSVPDDVVPDEVAKWAVVKDDLSPKEMFQFQKQGSAERAIIAKYCVQDCQLVLDLFKKLDVFNNAMSMANVCSVPVSYIFLRGQGVKIESLMFKYCYERGQCIRVLPSSRGSGESYEGAIVLDPTPGFYTVPVGVADFASLYPSTIISENISHDTLVWVKDYDDKGNQIPVLDHEGNVLRWNQYGSDEYDNLSGVRYTDIEYDVMIDDPEDERKNKRKIKAGIRVCRYAQDKVGTIPQIVAGLLAARKAKRKEGEKATDPFVKALLDAEQLAYKLTANSLYGQLGSGTFKVRLQALAASVTAYGRKQILFSKAAIEKFYGPESGNPNCNASAETVYGDSVKGDTPIFIKRGSSPPQLTRIDELIKEGWTTWHETKEASETPDLSIWTEKGWTPLQRVIRHKLDPKKKMYRILTHTGVVDCTEDHSLVNPSGEELKPSDVAIGTELLHSNTLWKEFCQTTHCSIEENEAWAMGFFLADGSADTYSTASGLKSTWAINKADIDLLEEAQRKLPFETKILDTIESSGVYKLVAVGDIRTQANKYRNLFYNSAREKRVPECILNAPLPIVKSFLTGFYAGDGDKVGRDVGNYRWEQKGKEVSAGLCILAQRLGYSISINDRKDKRDVFRLTCTKGSQRKNTIAIKKMYELNTEGIEYVYDLQTDNHHFAVGPGNLVVHNTDSLFIAFNPKDPATGKPLEGQAALEATIALTVEAGKFVTKMLKAPHDFEFDKVYWPFIIFSKKRYVGHKYEDADKYCLWFMGVALKRRDYAAIVKRIYSGALNILLHERDVPKAAAFVQQMAVDLVEGRFGLQPLIISKSLKAEYNDPSRIAHKALADRMARRDPGNAPAAGDRIPFVYIQPPTGQAAPDLQGDRIETPSYIKEKGLKPDYMFYIDHQISNPICQLFGIVVDQIPGYSAYAPKGGWKIDNPDTLIAQRETAAYHLLFGKALERNSSSAKKEFAKLLGAVSSASTPSAKAAATQAVAAARRTSSRIVEAPKRQSTLDSMFMDRMRLDAVKVISDKRRKSRESSADKSVKSGKSSS